MPGRSMLTSSFCDDLIVFGRCLRPPSRRAWQMPGLPCNPYRCGRV